MNNLTIGVHAAGPSAPETVQNIVAAEKAGLDVAWLTSGGVAPDPLVVFSAAADQASRIDFGTCIIPTFPRHPLALAQGALAVDQLAPGRLRLGVGPSHEPFVTATYGYDWVRPLQHLREYVTVLKTLFETGKVDFHGERIDATAGLAGPVGVRVMISALRTNAFRLAGEVADGGISWVSPLPHIKSVAAPAIAEGASKAGRETPPVVVHQPIVVSTDRDAVVAAAQQQYGFYPSLPFYRAMWHEAGFPEAGEGPASAAMMDALVISGSPDQVAERVAAMPKSGAGEMIADVVNLPGDDSARARTLGVLGDLAKGS